MSAFTRRCFGAVAPFLWDYGYQPVPIAPGYKAPLLEDWQAGHPPVHWLPEYRRWYTGILTATTPAVDLDIKDRELVRVLIELAGEELGYAPFRMGQPPKVILPFATDRPFDKIAGRWWALPGEDCRAERYGPHRIEILGNGQQFVAYAIHPGTKRPYRWRKGCPMEVPRVDLPKIDEAAARAFLATAEGVIEECGGVPLKRVDKVWRPDLAEPEHVAQPRGPREDNATVPVWQMLEPETLAKRIDARHARRTKSGWITACPAHHSEGARSLHILPRDRGGSYVYCFAECSWSELSRAISSIVG